MKIKDYIIMFLIIVIVGMGVMFLRDKKSTSNLSQNPVDQSSYEAKQLKNTLTKHMSDLQPCYLEFLEKKPQITEGKIDVDWYVKTNGTVEKADIVSSAFDDKSFGECVVKKLSTWEFPLPPGDKSIYVQHTFFFKDVLKKKSN